MANQHKTVIHAEFQINRTTAAFELLPCVFTRHESMPQALPSTSIPTIYMHRSWCYYLRATANFTVKQAPLPRRDSAKSSPPCFSIVGLSRLNAPIPGCRLSGCEWDPGGVFRLIALFPSTWRYFFKQSRQIRPDNDRRPGIVLMAGRSKQRTTLFPLVLRYRGAKLYY